MAKINNKQINQQQQSQIPRPLNCFLMYRLEKQKEIVAKCPSANHRDISKIIAKWWQEATEEEKKPFRERARLAKKEHNELYPDYKYAPKKKVTPKRIYVRRNKKQQFTSRAKENNKLMEMIYEDPSALKDFTATEEATTTTIMATVVSSESDKGYVPLSPQSEWNSTKVKTENEDVCYRSTCSFSPMSFASAITPFDSPHVSRYSDYSESEISSPVSSYETAMYSSATSCSSDPFSPFSVLDLPFINDSNAYANTTTNYDMEMVDYFHFDHSNLNNNTKSTQEFSWIEPCNDLVQEQEQLFDFMQQTYEPPVKYINPALLQIMY